MSEKRPLYHATSHTPEQQPHRCDPTLSQHHMDGTMTRDTIILLPMLAVPHSHDQPCPCMQQVHLQNGDLGFCNVKTSIFCTGCGNAVCIKHYGKRFLSLLDANGAWQEEQTHLLCETCADLPKNIVLALHLFRRAINGEPVLLDHWWSRFHTRKDQ